MALNSLKFLVFLAAVLFVYYIVPKKYQWCVLLIASYGFYLASGITNTVYIIFTTAFTYLMAGLMQKLRNNTHSKIALLDTNAKDQKQALKKKGAKKIRALQVLTILVNLSVLAYMKYLNFFIGNLNNVFSIFKWDASIPLVNIIVPLGLSYYTFNTIGYIIDIGRGKYKAETHLGKYALFVSFFPSIVQGPLMRYSDVGAQLSTPHNLDYNNIKYGAQLILWGFFKKLVIADRVAVVTSNIFNPSFTDYHGGHIFFAVLMYSLQIYGDFSGGTDITRGAAQMMGINLPLNFERPFFANSMADFWRRWHMSLGAWMREYVFYPIMLCKPVSSLSKKFRKRYGVYAGKLVPSVAAPMVVFFLIGIWHGLTWQYIINGLYNAILISSSVACEPLFKKLIKIFKINDKSFIFRVFQILRTFILLCISRCIVKAPGIHAAVDMLKSMFFDFDLKFMLGFGGEIFTFGFGRKDTVVILISVIILFVIGVMQEKGIKIRESLAKKNIVIRWALIYALLFFVLIFGVYGPSYNATSFIYGRF